MKKSLRLYVEGAVQGIFYRNFVKENAEKYGVNGFVRNLEDGRIEVFLEGDGETVNKMIEICQQGPKHSQVKKITMKTEPFQGLKNFKVLHI